MEVRIWMDAVPFFTIPSINENNVLKVETSDTYA